MTLLYRNHPWMYDFLLDESRGLYFLRVVCGTIGLYEMCLQLTIAETMAFQQDLAAGDDEKLTLLAKQVMSSAPTGIANRQYLR